ncbi:MAG: tetratricopeptide repeat protein [Promethearchaeota archaeon]
MISIFKKKDKPEELIQVKHLLEECKFDEAELLIRNFEEKGRHTLHDLVLCHLLKCELLFWRGLHTDVIKLAEQTYKESLELGKNFLSFDILLRMADALNWLGQSDKLYDIIKNAEELLKTLPQELPTDYKQREASIAWLKGWFYIYKRDADQALKQFKHSLALREEFGGKLGIAYSLVGIALVYTLLKGDYIRAVKYYEQSTTIAEESGNNWCIGFCKFRMAEQHVLKGDLDNAIMLYKQVLIIFNELNNKYMVGWILNSIGEAYRQRGDLDRALESLEQSLAIDHELGRIRDLALDQDALIHVLIDKGDTKRAEQALHDLKQLLNQLEDEQINESPKTNRVIGDITSGVWNLRLEYLLNKALVLKTNPRARNRAKAEEIFKQILEDENSSFGNRFRALINLCELLLTELNMTNDLEVLEEINPLIEELLDISEKSHSYSILCETHLLQAKLSLLTFDIKKAQRFLTQAQQIAERFGLKLLAIKISNEYDELLKQLNIWEKLKESSPSLKERMEFARLNEQMENMIQKRAIKVPDLSDEEPVLLLIVSEGGRPFFSQLFVKDQTFEDHLFGGFFTAINSFISEKFSEGLDRAIFGKHTLLMKSIAPFFMCYIFKGQSYLAQQRIRYFIDKIQNDELIWQNFIKFYQLNQEIQVKEIPSLESLIKDIFIDKSYPLIV